MKRLLHGGTVINVFTGELEQRHVLIDDETIVGVGDYTEKDADVVEDVSGRYICPGFIDGHIHIESTMLTPAELARLCMPHGTTAIIADPHEIANVCGVDGMTYLLEASQGIPLNVYFTLPSCVPATLFDEAGAELTAEALLPFYASERVVGLGEMMNYPGVVAGNEAILRKIADALQSGKVVDGHAPGLTGRALDRYISAGIHSDHECTSAAEAMERVRKGQWVMIRQGTAARNLDALLPLFDPPFNHRCILVTDDRHPADLLNEGHIDHIIRRAVAQGKSAVTAIRMATLQAAQCFGLRHVGAIAPGYRADILVLDDLERILVRDVYAHGRKVVDRGTMTAIDPPVVSEDIHRIVMNSFHLDRLTPADFHMEAKAPRCRVMKVIPGQLITEEYTADIVWEKNNGVDIERDILKLAVIERHRNTGHRCVGFIHGISLKKGAIASSVSHDAHNIIVIGANEEDMAVAANHIRETGGNVVVADGQVIADMRLPIAGLMTELSGEEIARVNAAVRDSVYALGVHTDVEPFMNMAFVSLAVIPSLKMTTQGLIDVNRQTQVSLYCDDP